MLAVDWKGILVLERLETRCRNEMLMDRQSRRGGVNVV